MVAPGSQQAPSRPLSPSLLPQSRDRKMVGDVIGAQSFASTAKCLNIWALVLGIIMLAVSIAVIAVFFTVVGQLLKQMPRP